MAMPLDVLGLGAGSVDYVAFVPAWPAPDGPGAKVRVRRREVFCGGQTMTALATCARFGLRTAYAGAVGDDEDGRRLRRALEAAGVGTARLVVRRAPSPSALIIVDEGSGERLVLWERDDRLRLSREEVLGLDPGAARLIHVDDVDEDAAVALARLARQQGLPVTTDIERATDRTRELIGLATYAVLAEPAAPALAGGGDQAEALRTLRRTTAAVLCVTLGERGALLLDGDRLHHEPGFDVRAVDTTGAGDVFRGGFIYGVLAGWPLDRTVRFACAAAAVACTRAGAIAGVPALDEVHRLAAAQGRPIGEADP